MVAAMGAWSRAHYYQIKRELEKEQELGQYSMDGSNGYVPSPDKDIFFSNFAREYEASKKPKYVPPPAVTPSDVQSNPFID